MNPPGLDQSPLDSLTHIPPADPMLLAGALASAAAAIARLDQALVSHPLAQAFLYRARLDSVRRQAAIDGQLIDPWQLAATIEGLRLRMDPYLRIIDRGEILERARTALTLHQWIVEPDFDQEGVIQRAEASLALQPTTLPPLIAAARSLHGWLEAGEPRAPMRSAIIRYWRKRDMLRLPVPLTGASALRAEQCWDLEIWIPAFLMAVENEALDGLYLLQTLERSWFEARRAVAGRRKNSHFPAAVDVLAAVPLLSATTLGHILGLAVKNAIRILDELTAEGVVVEVTHRSRRRLFGLKGLAPIRDVVRGPYRPEPGRGRGRPPSTIFAPNPDSVPPPALEPVSGPAPLSPAERITFDYSALEEAMAQLDAVVRDARFTLRHDVKAAISPI